MDQVGEPVRGEPRREARRGEVRGEGRGAAQGGGGSASPSTSPWGRTTAAPSREALLRVRGWVRVVPAPRERQSGGLPGRRRPVRGERGRNLGDTSRRLRTCTGSTFVHTRITSRGRPRRAPAGSPRARLARARPRFPAVPRGFSVEVARHVHGDAPRDAAPGQGAPRAVSRDARADSANEVWFPRSSEGRGPRWLLFRAQDTARRRPRARVRHRVRLRRLAFARVGEYKSTARRAEAARLAGDVREPREVWHAEAVSARTRA